LTAHPVGCGCAECQNPNRLQLVFRGKPTQNRVELFEGYSRQFRRAVDAVFAADETPELADRLRANVSRFAAYKSVYVEGEFAKIAANQEYDAATRKAAMRAAEDRFARWTDAEYNTATARCRTAKQFSEFLEPDNRRLFPNLQWLATRSATPRADHAAFAGKIWPKTDPFWNSHAPGTEWNCKCDIAETDEPATDNSDVPNIEPPRGLEGNPAETGEVFTDNVGYIKNAKPEVLSFVNECYYPDNKSALRISVNADRRELTDNIKTGRILAKTENVAIRPHIEQEPGKPTKNPEFLINDIIADAKRVESPNGITAGFKSAIKQNAETVIIDYGNGKYKTVNGVKVPIYYNARATAKAINDRYADFESRKIKYCYVVYNGKYVVMGSSLFRTINGNTKAAKFQRQEVIMGILKQLNT